MTASKIVMRTMDMDILLSFLMISSIIRLIYDAVKLHQRNSEGNKMRIRSDRQAYRQRVKIPK